MLNVDHSRRLKVRRRKTKDKLSFLISFIRFKVFAGAIRSICMDRYKKYNLNKI